MFISCNVAEVEELRLTPGHEDCPTQQLYTADYSMYTKWYDTEDKSEYNVAIWQSVDYKIKIFTSTGETLLEHRYDYINCDSMWDNSDGLTVFPTLYVKSLSETKIQVNWDKNVYDFYWSYRDYL